MSIELGVLWNVGEVVDPHRTAVRHPHAGVAHQAVPHRSRTIVQGPEVAVPVDEGKAQRPRLCHADEGVVDGAVAVGVQPTHDLADDAGALDVAAVGEEPHVVHRVEDAALHGLQAVARVGERAGVDDGVRVLQEGRLHLLLDVGVEDVLLEVVSRELGGVAACHGGHSPWRHRQRTSRHAATPCST